MKQGDALSCSLFILCMDPLIRKVNSDDKIEGLNMGQLSRLKGTPRIPSAVVLYQKPHVRGLMVNFFHWSTFTGEGINYSLLTTLKVLPALLGMYFSIKGSWIVRILLCLKHDLQPELGSGLPGR